MGLPEKIKIAALLLVALVAFSSCKKDKYDKPENVYPELPDGNITIAELKTRFIAGEPVGIEDDINITGIVIANDKSGSLFQTFVIDDGTAALPVLVDKTGLYVEFPVGRKINIKCKGLALGTDAGNIQLGGYMDGIAVQPMAYNLSSKHITSGTLHHDISSLIQPVTLTSINDLNNDLNFRLIKLENAEFDVADTGKVWLDINSAGAYVDANRSLHTCDNRTQSITVRTSRFSDFALTKVPAGNGSLIALYTVFNATKQLVIRDINDLNMTGERCTLPGTLTTISELRALFTSATTTVPDGLKIRGTVISDRTGGNENARNIVIQDATGGIVLRFAANHAFNMNDRIEVNLNGTSLSLFNGWLQVGDNIPLSSSEKMGTNIITPVTLSISDLIANYSQYESRLIKLERVKLSGGTSGTYANSVTMTQADGNSIVLNTNPNSATFSGNAYPTDTVNVVGYAAPFFNTKQIKIRNLDDVTP